MSVLLRILDNFNVIENLSIVLHTPEAFLRLLLTVLAGYPLAIYYRKRVCDRSATYQHGYFIISTFLLGYWNFGLDIFHPISAVAFTYVVLFILGGSSLSVAIVFIYNLGYLLVGYYVVITAYYEINWTIPQCVLVLRLIGVAFDLYDGQQDPLTLSLENRRTALAQCPSILEIYGHALFPASFFVGPQFSMKRYQRFTAGEFREEAKTFACVRAGTSKFGLGIFYMVLLKILDLVVSDVFMYSEEFADMNFFKKLILLGLWGRLFFYKYVSCWLFTEGACILFGLAYNDTDEYGVPQWNGVENVNVAVLENAEEMTDYIESFNIGTNRWIAKYIYKRLKFLENRYVSHLAALLFLAVWHGFHSGYYVCFFFEFAVVCMERDVKSIVASNAALSDFFSKEPVQLVVHFLLRLYCFTYIGWCTLPMGLLTYDRYLNAFASLYHFGYILILLWMLFRAIFRPTTHPSSD